MLIRMVDYLLAIVGFAGHIVVLALLLRRRLFARLPAFGFLLAFYILRTSVSYLLSPAPADLGWSLAAVDPLLQTLVFLSIIPAFRPVSTRGSTRSGFGILLLAFAVAALAAWYLGPSSHFSSRNLLLKAGIFVSVLWLQAPLLAFLASSRLAVARNASPHWQIALGFAVYSAVDLLAIVARYHLQSIGGMAWYLVLAYLPVAAYFVTLGIWIAACWRAQLGSAGNSTRILSLRKNGEVLG